MPTRRALIAAMIPAVVVFAIFWRWLDFPMFIAVGLGAVWGVASVAGTAGDVPRQPMQAAPPPARCYSLPFGALLLVDGDLALRQLEHDLAVDDRRGVDLQRQLGRGI